MQVIDRQELLFIAARNVANTAGKRSDGHRIIVRYYDIARCFAITCQSAHMSRWSLPIRLHNLATLLAAKGTAGVIGKCRTIDNPKAHVLLRRLNRQRQEATDTDLHAARRGSCDERG